MAIILSRVLPSSRTFRSVCVEHWVGYLSGKLYTDDTDQIWTLDLVMGSWTGQVDLVSLLGALNSDLEFFQSCAQCLNSGHIQMVSRLIQDQEVRPAQENSTHTCQGIIMAHTVKAWSQQDMITQQDVIRIGLYCINEEVCAVCVCVTDKFSNLDKFAHSVCNSWSRSQGYVQLSGL